MVNVEKLESLANELFAWAQEPDNAYVQPPTAENVTEFWVESWYSLDDHSSFPCEEHELNAAADLLVPLLVARGLPQS